MDPILKKRFRESILQLNDNNFQEFCQELFLAYYKNNFQVIKNKRDKGCDGIITNKIIVAMYSPEKIDLRNFKKKVEEDFKSYKENWQANYSDWLFVYNGEMTAERKLHLDEFILDSPPMDIDNILFIVNKLKYNDILALGKYLRIDKELISYNIMRCVIEDLTKDICLENISLEKPIYIEDKIKINFSPEKQEEILKDYMELLPEINRLRKILKDYDENENTALKMKIKKTLDCMEGDFNRKIESSIELLSGGHEEDDIYILYLRVIIIYLFEYCLLGKKTKEEIKC